MGFSAESIAVSDPDCPNADPTTTLNCRRLRWFEVCACTPTSRDPPSSLVKHRFRPYLDGRVRSTQTPDPIRLHPPPTLFPEQAHLPIALRIPKRVPTLSSGET